MKVLVLANILAVLDQFVSQELLEMGADSLHSRYSIDDIARKMITIQSIHHCHIKRCRGRALFFIASDMKIIVTVVSIS